MSSEEKKKKSQDSAWFIYPSSAGIRRLYHSKREECRTPPRSFDESIRRLQDVQIISSSQLLMDNGLQLDQVGGKVAWARAAAEYKSMPVIASIRLCLTGLTPAESSSESLMLLHSGLLFSWTHVSVCFFLSPRFRAL